MVGLSPRYHLMLPTWAFVAQNRRRNVDLLASVIFKELILISGLPASVHVLIHLLALWSQSRDNLKPTITPRPPGISSKIASIELNTLCEHNKLKKSYLNIQTEILGTLLLSSWPKFSLTSSCCPGPDSVIMLTVDWPAHYFNNKSGRD